ncbi:hypothetical protein K435DRAFT_795355 [Dendrothele bispora CBS 962.96]|uniref:Osmotin, thaumatin-like protein n=1 Tax=Dendrothele bispora (strain CBS 962.96) TaxID=1314807 RepID=A0A4S8M9M2_DENBC|nr:hypothetical protein K435DRAFT_795355 [Dendrothele bispora CBS 962.96]
MFNTGKLVSLLTAATMVSASSLNINNKCDHAVTVQIALQGGTKPDVSIPAGKSAGGAQGIPQNGHGIALNFVTDSAQTNKAMSRAEVNFTPGDPAGAAFINLSNMFGYSVATELTGSGCADYVCNIGSNCPVPGPAGSCTSPCCKDFNSCQGASSCPVGSRGDQGGGPGPHADFYKGACPNSYGWGDEDSDEPKRNLGGYCKGDDIKVTLCPGKPSSHL